MRVSMKVDYGVRALIDLAQNHGNGPVQTAEIASRQSVPEPYLDQLLTSLKKVGFVRSRRGPPRRSYFIPLRLGTDYTVPFDKGQSRGLPPFLYTGGHVPRPCKRIGPVNSPRRIT